MAILQKVNVRNTGVSSSLLEIKSLNKMKEHKFRIILEDERFYRVQKKTKGWFSKWNNCDYFYKLEDAEKVYDRLLLYGTQNIIKESEWIKK